MNEEDLKKLNEIELITLLDEFRNEPFGEKIKLELYSREIFKDIIGNDIKEIKRVLGILADEKGINYFW